MQLRSIFSSFNALVFLVNIGFLLLLLLSYFAPIIRPETSSLIALLGLGFPVLIGIHIAFVLYWLINWDKRFVFSFISLCCGWFILKDFYALTIFKKPIIAKHAIKVMSYNVNNFDFYKWDTTKVSSRKKIIGFIAQEHPDIVCLQEFYTINHPRYDFNTLDTLRDLMQPIYHEFDVKLHAKFDQKLGLIVFSRYRIIRKGEINFATEGLNACMFVDVVNGTDTVRVYNLHLQSIQFESVKYRDSLDKPLMRIDRIAKGFVARAQQVLQIEASLKSCKYPVILCGDFNDIPSSYAYSQLRHNLQDAFNESGNGIGATYGGMLGLLRIDYILHSDFFKSIDFSLNTVNYSDHYPISATLSY